MSKGITVKTSQPYFRKWDIMTTGTGEGIIVRVKNKGGSITATVVPYERQETKLAQFVYLWVLKFLVFLKII